MAEGLILLIYSNLADSILISEAFRTFGIINTTVHIQHTDAEFEYLQKMKMEDITLIIADFDGDTFNCVELLDTIRNIEWLSKVPVAIFSSLDSKDDEAMCLAAGAAKFFIKPLNSSDCDDICWELYALTTLKLGHSDGTSLTRRKPS